MIPFQARENIDLSLEHNFSWDLGAGGNINKWYNDTVLGKCSQYYFFLLNKIISAYNVIRTKHADSAEIRASLFLNDVIRDSMHTDKVIVQIIRKIDQWPKISIIATHFCSHARRQTSALVETEDTK